MIVKFKNTYCVSILDLCEEDVEFQLADYDTFSKFEDDLKSYGIKWKKNDGCFSRRGHEDLSFVISEKSYPGVADWSHTELEDYMQKHLSDCWSEDSESTFFACGLSLKDAFNQLKKIDGKEIELEADVNPGDYVNKYEGPYVYGKSWNKVKSICDKGSTTVADTINANNKRSKNGMSSLSSYIKHTSEKPKYADEYVDLEALVNNLFR